MSSPVEEVLELRLTNAQMAAIIARIEARKRKIVGCGEIDLGEISSAPTEIAQALTDEVWATGVVPEQRLNPLRYDSLE